MKEAQEDALSVRSSGGRPSLRKRQRFNFGFLNVLREASPLAASFGKLHL